MPLVDWPVSLTWAGPGDAAIMRRYCQARADRDADLTHLLIRDVFPVDRVDAVVFRTVDDCGELRRAQTWRSLSPPALSLS